MGIADRCQKMRHITHCPACETQFFVTDEQLSQHEGKVRCGQCLHVFNAKQQIIEIAEVRPDEITTDNPIATTALSDQQFSESPLTEPQPVITASDEPIIADPSPSYFDDFLDRHKRSKNRRLTHKWLWWILAIILILLAIAQSLYFLRNEVALYYPITKPYLEQACLQLHCKIELPKMIEFIVIDDSDIQEDAQHQGLIWLSSTLVNQASFTQAFPNLELTLTNVEDQPKFRKVISPKDYLPAGRDIQRGLSAHEEIRIRLPINTQNEVLAGYRVLVTY